MNNASNPDDGLGSMSITGVGVLGIFRAICRESCWSFKFCKERRALRTSAHIGWFGYLLSGQPVSGFVILISYYLTRNATIPLLSVLGFRHIAVASES